MPKVMSSWTASNSRHGCWHEINVLLWATILFSVGQVLSHQTSDSCTWKGGFWLKMLLAKFYWFLLQLLVVMKRAIMNQSEWRMLVPMLVLKWNNVMLLPVTYVKRVRRVYILQNEIAIFGCASSFFCGLCPSVLLTILLLVYTGNCVMSGMKIDMPAWCVTVMQCLNMAMNTWDALQDLL